MSVTSKKHIQQNFDVLTAAILEQRKLLCLLFLLLPGMNFIHPEATWIMEFACIVFLDNLDHNPKLSAYVDLHANACFVVGEQII